MLFLNRISEQKLRVLLPLRGTGVWSGQEGPPGSRRTWSSIAATKDKNKGLTAEDAEGAEVLKQ